MHRCFCNSVRLFFLTICFCGFALANRAEIPREYFTPQEVEAHFSADQQIKKSVFVATNPYTAPDWVLILRSLINRNYWQEREARGAKEVSFKEPLLVRSVVQLDKEIYEEVKPVIKANARVRTKQDLRDFKVRIARLEAERDTLSRDTYKRRKRELNEWYKSGSKEALFEKWIRILTTSFEKDYSARYLLPTFYKGDLEGFIGVEAEKRYKMERHFSGFRRPLGYPLSVDVQEAKEIAATTAEPTLVNLGQVVRVETEERLFWLMDDKVVGAMSGALYEVVDAEGNTANPLQVEPEVRRGGAQPGELEWFYLELPVTLEPLEKARYRWSASLTPAEIERPWSQHWPYIVIGLSAVISFSSLFLTVREKK